MAKPIIIIGQQRSGTTALQSALSYADGVRNFGEIFQFQGSSIEEVKHNFYYYINHVRQGLPALTSADQAESELKRYLDYLDSMAPGKFYILDIKYNLWHHFAPGWFNPFGRPFMLEYFKKMKAPVIHVVRKNLFRQYVSNEFAARTRRWHYQQEQAAHPSIPPFEIDIKDLAAHFEAVTGNEALFRKRLEGYPQTVEVTYETLFNGRNLTAPSQAQLRKVIPGSVLEKSESRFIKPKSDPVDWVNNAEELIEHFSDTPFGVMVMDALRPPLPQKSDRVITDCGGDQATDPVDQEAEHEDRGGSPEGARVNG